MPTAVKKVRWKCEQCGKSRWLKPWEARKRRFCSRECLHAGLRVPEPVRANQGAKKTFGQRKCGWCGEPFEAKAAHQKLCSQACSVRNAQNKRRGLPVEPRPCGHCGT